jgi:L-aminopeptidase/D-esterase-like protein
MPPESAVWDALPWRAGHWTHPDGVTGCTVILCPPGTVGAGEVRGAAPGTRETDLLAPGALVQHVDAVLLTGGSAFGLAAADGVMRYLREQRAGYRTGPEAVPVPIVPAAVIYDRGAVDGIAPDAEAGYRASRAAAAGTPAPGRAGAGVGARVGKLAGRDRSSPGGLGHAVVRVGTLAVGALMVVNPVGEVRDPATGQIIAGVRAAAGPGFVPGLDVLAAQAAHPDSAGALPPFNTVIGVVATNAPLDRDALAVVLRMADAGVARTVHPAHTMFDGDTLFALALPSPEGQAGPLIDRPRPAPGLVNLAGALAAEVVSRAILNAVRS